MQTTISPVAGFLLLLGLGFFFGLAFEEFHAQGGLARPGGVRSFPLLALSGGLLYLLWLSAGLLVLGAWLTCYYWRHVEEIDPDGRPNVGLMVPICNVLAYLLGPMALAEPPWVDIGTAVTALLLFTARERLHGLPRRVETGEIVTAGKFLILTGLVLPFLPDKPITGLSEITPHQVWLAVVAVSTVSYASYLLRRYVAPPGANLWVAVLGGLYSSTVTTVVLARRACDAAAGADPPHSSQLDHVRPLADCRRRLRSPARHRPRARAAEPGSVWSAPRRVVVLGERFADWRVAARGQGSRQSAGSDRRLHFCRPVHCNLARLKLGPQPIRRKRPVRIGGRRRPDRHRSVRAQPRRGRH